MSKCTYYFFSFFLWLLSTLYSGHHWDLKIVSVIERCQLHRGSSQISLFCFRNLLSTPKCVKKKHKENIIENIMFIWSFGSHWLAIVCNVWRSQPTKWIRMLLLWFVPIVTVKKGKVGLVQPKSPWLHPCFSPCPTTLWASLQLGNTWKRDECGLKIPAKFHFYELEKAIKLAKKITKIGENINETVKHCLK